MADYLNRLIQRVNGQLPVVRPLLRSSYAPLPLFNEATTEFEQVVTFDGGVNSPVSERTTPTLSHQETQTTRQSSAGEISELPDTGKKSEAESTIDSSRASVPLVDNSSAQSLKNERNETSLRQRLDSNRKKKQPYLIANQIDNNATEFSRDSVFERQPIKNDTRDNDGIGRPNRQKIRAVPLKDIKLTTESPRKHDTEETEDKPGKERDAGSTDSVNTEEMTISHEVGNFPHELATARGVDLSRRSRPLVNIKQNPRLTPFRAEARSRDTMETSSAINVRITIGRVEIKAVQQPERQSQRIPSAPQRPAVSLDAYLNGRDEGKP